MHRCKCDIRIIRDYPNTEAHPVAALERTIVRSKCGDAFNENSWRVNTPIENSNNEMLDMHSVPQKYNLERKAK